MRDGPSLVMIAYCFPPLGGAGVFRTLKLVKYLPANGVTPSVIAADDDTWPIIDAGLLEQVPKGVRVERVAPSGTLERMQALYRIARSSASARGEGPSVAVDFTSGQPTRRPLRRRVMDRLLVPDEKKYWIRPAIAATMRSLDRIEGDVCLYSTGPPHTDHVVALEVKRRTGLPWIADFRDAWAGNPVYMDGLSSPVRARHLGMERAVVENADIVLAVAPGILESLKAAHPQHVGKMRLLTNGFDPEDFTDVAGSPPTDALMLSHVGELYPTRDPSALLRAVNEARQRRPDLPIRLRFVGHRDPVIAARMDALIVQLGLTDIVTAVPPVAHSDAIRLMKESHVLVFQSAFRPGDAETGRTYPGKIFEYMAAGRPVLGIVPGGEAARLIDDVGCGWWRSPDDVPGLVDLIVELGDRWSRGESLLACEPDLRAFDRRETARAIADIVRDLVMNRGGAE